MQSDKEKETLSAEIARCQLVIEDLTAQGMKFGAAWVRDDITRAKKAIRENNADEIFRMIENLKKVH